MCKSPGREQLEARVWQKGADQTVKCSVCGDGVLTEHVRRKPGLGRKVYLYTCDECPFVGMEFHLDGDLEVLGEFLRDRICNKEARPDEV